MKTDHLTAHNLAPLAAESLHDDMCRMTGRGIRVIVIVLDNERGEMGVGCHSVGRTEMQSVLRQIIEETAAGTAIEQTRIDGEIVSGRPN